MFKLPSLRSAHGPRPDGGRKRYPALEPLEGRALLSTVHAAALQRAAARSADVLPLTTPVPVRTLHPGPIHNEIGVGFAVKSPRFYPFYAGARRGELNAAGAKAFVDPQGNAILVGIVAGTINDKPETVDDSENYVWLIDRGLSGGGPGPFPRRPLIKFDAIVAVSITPDGTSGFTQDLASGVSTPLATDQISVGTDSIKVAVPTSQFVPPGSTLSVTPTVNFAPLGSAPTDGTLDVTSFASEFRNFPISLGPIPHRGRH